MMVMIVMIMIFIIMVFKTSPERSTEGNKVPCQSPLRPCKHDPPRVDDDYIKEEKPSKLLLYLGCCLTTTIIPNSREILDLKKLVLIHFDPLLITSLKIKIVVCFCQNIIILNICIAIILRKIINGFGFNR